MRREFTYWTNPTRYYRWTGKYFQRLNGVKYLQRLKGVSKQISSWAKTEHTISDIKHTIHDTEVLHATEQDSTDKFCHLCQCQL